MKRVQLNDTAHAAMPESSPAKPPELRLALAQLERCRRALAASQEECDVVRLQLGIFMSTISRLRRRVTHLEQALAQAGDAAQHDKLTGLPNRSLLLDRLRQAIRQAERQHRQVGLLLVDLAGSRGIADGHGRATADKLVLQVAQRLLSCIRSADTACRHDGDQFLVLLPELESEKVAAQIARDLGARLAVPYLVDGQEVAIRAGIGVAIYPDDGTGLQPLIDRASLARVVAKARDDLIVSASSEDRT
jgi:diguanylate cyclase